MNPARGVTRSGRRWTARIRIDRQLINLGTFDTIQEASAAYVAARLQREPESTAVANDRDFILLDVQLLWASASEHLDEELKTGNPTVPEQCENRKTCNSTATEDRVVGLMAALEASVSAAKKTRSEMRS